LMIRSSESCMFAQTLKHPTRFLGNWVVFMSLQKDKIIIESPQLSPKASPPRPKN
jgi:hypothetical protein